MFDKRSDKIEIMDDLTCQGEEVNQTLRELEIINSLLGGNYVTLNGIAKLVALQPSAKKISITDLGCGGGDILRLISTWGKKKRLNLALTGIDANENIIRFAKEQGVKFADITFETVDIFSEQFKAKRFDILVGTLFFHHFTDKQLIDFFKQARAQAHLGIVVNDIHRHGIAYYSIKTLTMLFSKSKMVKYDAPLSVLRAFRKKDLTDILDKAGIKKYTIKWMWAFRWQVIIINV
jgi:2-polyprenyl-3-methyl-5-hydroxy-6-metoxy-1,4-benzoquinol methylase